MSSSWYVVVNIKQDWTLNKRIFANRPCKCKGYMEVAFSHLTPRAKPWVIQTFLTFDCKAVEQYFIVVLFIFQFWTGHCQERKVSVRFKSSQAVEDYFGKFIDFGLGTVRNESVKVSVYP